MSGVGEPSGFDGRYVLPYYLELMAYNAADVNHGVLSEIRARAAELSSEEVRRMVLDSWRPRVMGAWYAIACHRPELDEAVHASLLSCSGHLTSPPLIVAALQYARDDTLTTLDLYEEEDRAQGWGAAGLAVAAAHVLGGRRQTISPLGSPAAKDLERLESLMRIAQLLRSG